MDIVADSKVGEDNKKRTGVVLIHGLTGTPVEMKPLEKYLRKLGIDVENVLLAGHGGSNDDVIASSWKQWLESARQGVKKILATNDRVIICGLSMGSILASCLAAEESRVSAVVLCSSTLYYDGSVLENSIIDWVYHSELPTKFMKWLVQTFPLVGKKCYWEELPPYGIRDERIQRQITKAIEAARNGGNNEFGVFRTYYRPLTEMLDLVSYARKLFPKVKVPVLQLHSLDDTLASVSNATDTYLNLGSNNKALFLLTGCDHVMTLDLQRNLVHKMIGRFVQSFSEPSTEYKTVRSVISPVLSESRFAKGGTISALVSPEMHGLNKDEWKALYPGRRFAHLASVSDVHELHSIVMRDTSVPLMSLPVFIGEYGQSSSADPSSKIWEAISNLIASKDATVFGVGSTIVELPGLGLNKSAAEESNSKALSHLIRIVESMGKSAGVDAYTSVQTQVPELPQPAELHRANDNKPVRLNAKVHRLLNGTDTFCHRNPFREFFARFVQIALPQPGVEHDREVFEPAISVG